MERCVKSVELTCQRQASTTTHDIPQVLKRLPADWEITEDLRAAWRNVPRCLHVYSAILFKGLNQYTGRRMGLKLYHHSLWICYQEKIRGMYSDNTVVTLRKPWRSHRETS